MPNYVKIINVGPEYVIVKSGLSNIWFRCAMKPEVSSESLRISPQADSGNYCSLRLSGWGVAKPEVFLKKVWGSHLRLFLAITVFSVSMESGWGVPKPEVFLKKVWGSHQSHLRLILAIASLGLSVSLSLSHWLVIACSRITNYQARTCQEQEQRIQMLYDLYSLHLSRLFFIVLK